MAQPKDDFKQKYKTMFSELTQIINDWDPYGLIDGGAPADEFEAEVAKVLAGLAKSHSVKDVVQLVSDVFSESFEKEKFSVKSCKEVGKKVYAWYNGFRKSIAS